tara:strand:+ start:660 stop:1127 length:468 start_codon:yes stop_codon:yes gene_type:complete
MFKTIVLFIFTTLIATLLVCIVSTQIVLADVQSFGLNVSHDVRLNTTLDDLIGLGPVLYILITSGFLIGFIIAKYAHKYLGGNRTLWYVAAGCTTFPLTTYIIQYSMGLTILAAVRTPMGLFLATLCCIFSAWLFAFLSSRSHIHANNLGKQDEK